MTPRGLVPAVFFGTEVIQYHYYDEAYAIEVHAIKAMYMCVQTLSCVLPRVPVG